MKATGTKHIRAAAAIFAVVLISSCAAEKQTVKPVSAAPPAPILVPKTISTQVPKPAPALDWNDAPLTPGTWSWSMEGGKSVARFDGTALVLTCNREAGTITLQRYGTSTESSVPITIITSFFTRTLSAEPQIGSTATPNTMLGLNLPARDALLDAMAFSRGRFAIETAGLPTLYLPSWPEVSRVVEDCR